jgi:hypothetical protein
MAIDLEKFNGLPDLVFEPHGGFGKRDPDGVPFPFGYISNASPVPIFELNVFLAHDKELLAKIASAAVAAPSLIAEIKKLTKERDDLISLVQRWVALDGGAWHIERHAREKEELKADSRKTLEGLAP